MWKNVSHVPPAVHEDATGEHDAEEDLEDELRGGVLLQAEHENTGDDGGVLRRRCRFGAVEILAHIAVDQLRHVAPVDMLRGIDEALCVRGAGQ